MVMAGLERAAESLMETPTVTGDAAVEQVRFRVDKFFGCHGGWLARGRVLTMYAVCQCQRALYLW
jgi:hypothetical protein